jgi:hypothetical protein
MYDGINFYIAGNSGFLSTSTDGITWTSRTSGTTSTIGLGNNGEMD